MQIIGGTVEFRNHLGKGVIRQSSFKEEILTDKGGHRHGTARDEKKHEGMQVQRKWVWSVAACSNKIEKQYKPREKTTQKTRKVMQICGCTVEITSPLAQGVVAKNSFEGGKCLRHGRAGTAARAGME